MFMNTSGEKGAALKMPDCQLADKEAAMFQMGLTIRVMNTGLDVQQSGNTIA
jgi:hypothetical protein